MSTFIMKLKHQHKMTPATAPKPAKRTQGMKWIRLEKRYAIYMRDGLRCAYCGTGIEDSKMTLDHLKPYSEGGSNEATNLVTCCSRCNSSRGNRPVITFAVATANYLNNGVTAKDIIKHLKKTSARELDIPAAKELIKRSGSCFKSK